MQAIALCRFSYPALGGFQITHDTVQDRIRFFYSPARLEERFKLFEHVALPCLRAQTDPRFSLIIVIGDSLPRPYHDRLRDLVSYIPQIRIESHAPQQHRNIMKKVLARARGDRDAPCLQFRFDDYDAIGTDFIATLRAEATASADLTSRYQAVAFDWHRGIALQCGPDGIGVAQVHHRLNVAALGVHIRAGSRLTIMNFAHHRLDRFMPVVSFADSPMWIETHNRFNDSASRGPGPKGFRPVYLDDGFTLQDRFGVNPANLKAAFAPPADVRDTA